ncbi:hypothetical protein BaRGS_00034305 [Batillaria attramentaria]|uniref:Uncharacterized protein n=1 Tax=Batillaria attramentaria TaxID=370345 RepID=A0ABD0JID9_9CAEN
MPGRLSRLKLVTLSRAISLYANTLGNAVWPLAFLSRSAGRFDNGISATLYLSGKHTTYPGYRVTIMAVCKDRLSNGLSGASVTLSTKQHPPSNAKSFVLLGWF